MNEFNISEELKLGTVNREKKPKSILTYVDGVVKYVTLDDKPKQGQQYEKESPEYHIIIKDF